MNQIAEPATSYGGPWTLEKLDILEEYLDAYTKVLKEKYFKLMYIDAFAGTGYVEFQDEHAKYRIDGSATRAIGIKAFEKLIFIEKDQNRCYELEKLKQAHSDRNVQIENFDANDYLKNLRQDWKKWRGVLFLDPFATEVQWSTIEIIATFNALDTWILFPTSAVARMLPTSKMPDNVSRRWADRLTNVFGDESWRDLYQPSPQMNFLDTNEHVREEGVKELIKIYKRNLKPIFQDRFLSKSRTLRNSKNSALFEFLFCVGNPSGVGPAKRIATHLLNRI